VRSGCRRRGIRKGKSGTVRENKPSMEVLWHKHLEGNNFMST